MRNCTKLHNTNLPSLIQKVFITPDLTPKEQAVSKKLRAELKKLNKDGKKFRIKNWKIVQRSFNWPPHTDISTLTLNSNYFDESIELNGHNLKLMFLNCHSLRSQERKH